MSEVPKGLFGPHLDGLGDPDRMTIAERAVKSEARAVEQRARRTSLSPRTRQFQAAADRALGGR